MAEIHHVTPDRHTGALADVIFVHGLGGDKFTTWQATQSRESFWPEWLGKDLPDVAVYSLGYEASPSAWLGHAMPLTERATNILNLLESEGLGVRPLIWICHSLGGLVVKQLLQTAEIQNQLSWKCFVENTKAIVFLSTPHAGAQIANAVNLMGKLLRTTAGMTDLQASNEHLRYLSLWYSNNAARLKIETRVFYEKRDLGGIRIVNEDTANPGISGVMPVAMDDHHLSICKPADRNQQVYKSVRLLVSQYENPKPTSGANTISKEDVSSEAGLPDRKRRFFISYRRRAHEDARLANRLVDELRNAGHDVFIDLDITLGADWSAEITRRIEWCEYLVVLLSEDSIDAEMVQGEIRLARHNRRDDGSPHIIPIRVRYEGGLDYELTSYLGRLQHVVWNNSRDDAAVISAVLKAAQTQGAGEAIAANVSEQPPVTTDERRPQPSVDRTALLRPTGTLKLDDRFYVKRSADESIDRLAASRGETLVIKGARQMGKSSLLVRYIAACKQAGTKVAFLDFQGMSDAQLVEYPTFLQRVLNVLLRRLELPTENLPSIESGLDVTDLIESRVLDRIDAPVLFAFEEVDRVLGRPWQKDFFAMLRDWHNRRWMEPWAKVDIGLVIATEPYLLVDSADQSPFNVGEILQLGPFLPAEVNDLNKRYGAPLSASQCQELFELTNGQPYLTRVALYRLVSDANTTWRTLQTSADSDQGPFADHLKALLMILHRSGLEEAMREVVKRGRIPGDDRLTYYRLRGAGLVTEEASGQKMPANLLYARFFKKLLK